MLQQRTDLQRSFSRSRRGHGQPALKQPEHATGARTIVQVHVGGDAVPCIKRIIPLPAALENLLIHARILGIFPSLYAAAVRVRAQRELRITRPPDPEPIRV